MKNCPAIPGGVICSQWLGLYKKKPQTNKNVPKEVKQRNESEQIETIMHCVKLAARISYIHDEIKVTKYYYWYKNARELTTKQIVKFPASN